MAIGRGSAAPRVGPDRLPDPRSSRLLPADHRPWAIKTTSPIHEMYHHCGMRVRASAVTEYTCYSSGSRSPGSEISTMCRGSPPFSGVQSEDRVDCHVRDRGGMSVPRIKTCSRDNVG